MGHVLARPLLLLALLALVAVGLAAPAGAETTCTGTMGATTIDDDVVVPTGASCSLDGTTVTGNVLVQPGATLSARGASIDGNVQDDNGDAAHVSLVDTSVGGNVQLESGTSASVRDGHVDGDVQLESNTGQLTTSGTTIGGNLQANQNSGGVTITGNTIDGNLQCQSNDPAPTGGDNVVQGDAEGQCSDLSGSSTGDETATAREMGRLGGADRFATAVRITRAAYPQGAPVVYLARADHYPDALVAGNLSDGPVLLVPSCGDVPGVVLDEIRRLDPQRVVALGGELAVCDDVLRMAADA